MTITNQTSLRANKPRRLHARWRGFACLRPWPWFAPRLRGCTGEQFQKGYILPPNALEQIPIGASQDQVLIVMGTPSTVATLTARCSITSRSAPSAKSPS